MRIFNRKGEPMINIMKYFVLICAVGAVFSNAYAIEESKVPRRQAFNDRDVFYFKRSICSYEDEQ